MFEQKDEERKDKAIIARQEWGDSMKLFFNTLLYGDPKTKRILWSMVICSVLSVALIIAAIALQKLSLFGPVVILVVAVILISQMYDFNELKEDEEIEDDKPVEPEDVLVIYTEKKMKQVFVKFRVKPDHRAIMVDSSEKYKIKQTPAYAWVFRGRLHILLLEKNPREITIPLSVVGPVRYHRAVPISSKGEYVQFHKPTLLAGVFSDYLPSTYEQGKGSIKRRFKNLYIIGEDIAITNRSVRHIFDLTGTSFKIEDKLTESGDYGEDFIDMYKAYTLFHDQVIDANQYKQQVTRILDDMAMSNMLDAELGINLEKMQTCHFITPDYAKYCLEKRVKTVNENKKKSKR